MKSGMSYATGDTKQSQRMHAKDLIAYYGSKENYLANKAFHKKMVESGEWIASGVCLDSQKIYRGSPFK